ncbi:histidine triad (HIT) family protein [Haloarcula vallismortis]|uniref:Histidine triad (HIT) family protein n=1 Tax=Haloarcula vallismortis TaxID=28442 RepID=A0A1H2ZEM6_HALVA|nr:HIT family protein [Haloarcula vallismortis]SDX15943.1 histidine triad (HIT) family protein [Haloarcula vallismortis]
MPPCAFCDIVQGKAPAHRVYADEQTLAFLDTAPANPGHVLVIPTTHHETLTDMNEERVGAVFQTARRIASAIESAYAPDGLNIVQSNGAAAGQEVYHAHVHVIPRYSGDDVLLQWASGDAADGAQRTASTLQDEL